MYTHIVVQKLPLLKSDCEKYTEHLKRISQEFPKALQNMNIHTTTNIHVNTAISSLLSVSLSTNCVMI